MVNPALVSNNYPYSYTPPAGPQAGVSNYNNVPLPHAAPVDRVGVSSYGNYAAGSGYSGYNGVSDYGNNPLPYTAPVDRAGVSSYNGYNPSYTMPVDQAGVSVARNNFWQRVGAYLIDQIISSLILGFVFGVPIIIWATNFASTYGNQLSTVCGGSYSKGTYNRTACENLLNDIFLNQGELSSLLTTAISTFVVGLILMLAYQVIFTARGQTLGKKIFGLKVVRADGSPPGFGVALLRQTVGYFISNLFFGLGFLWVAFESNNRGWHDIISGTYVVPANPPLPPRY
jgi:uncharacterized RDD family membrane protein YckC